MGTPIVDVKILAGELAGILKNSAYRSFYAELLEQDRIDVWHTATHRARVAAKSMSATVKLEPRTVDDFALATVKRAFGKEDAPSLLHPIKVEEIVAGTDSVVFYRVFDGNLAATIGSWWSSPDLLREVTEASPCRDNNGQLKHNQVMQFMLSAGFVHPYWNSGKEVARMVIPAGVATPVIMGKGDWQAMKAATPRNPKAGDKDLKINDAGDVIDKLGMLPIPGPKQIFVPLFRRGWVTKVPHESKDWPFS